jgi:methylthioribose-1-phosphate isomerase
VTQPLRWQDGALLVLDQRALPDAERWIRCESAAEVADCIRAMAVRGAPAIGIAAAYGMALAGDERRAAAQLLRSARPTAANLAWAVERALEADDPLACATRLHREQEAADRRLADLGAERFAEGDRALTHCNAGALATAGYGTALGVIRSAWEQGKQIRVIADETRPVLQGARLTAWELMQDGIPVTLITDNMAGSLMRQGLIHLCLVGADRIAANGDVANKIGTYSVAVLAKAHAIPFYVAAPHSTIDLATLSGQHIPIEQRSTEEVTSVFGGPRIAPSGVTILNPAFDVTPASHITAIITERGVFPPDRLAEAFQASR